MFVNKLSTTKRLQEKRLHVSWNAMRNFTFKKHLSGIVVVYGKWGRLNLEQWILSSVVYNYLIKWTNKLCFIFYFFLFLSLTDHRIKRNFNFLPLTHPIFSFLHTKAAADNHVVIKKHKKFQIIYATLNKRNKRYHLTLQWLNKPVLLKWQRQEIPSNTKKNSVWESIAPLESRLFTQFRMGVGQIDLPTSFSTVTFTNAWISSQSFMTFIFNPFATLV